MGEETETGQSWEYRLRKYLLLLATLVVTVTYAAGFNPPGGVWQDTRDGQLAGDPIIRATHYHWFLAFYYCNATAFAASLVVIVLILVLAISHDKKIKKEEEKKVLWPLRVFMGLDVLSLMSAYGAGTYRDVVTVVLYCTVSVGTVLVYVVCIIIMQGLSCFPDEHPGSGSGPGPGRAKGKERHCKILMLLATFAVSVTYVAGLSTPGGFWDSTGGSHHPGDPILRDRHDLRLTVFLFCNTTAFVASLFITMQLIIDSKLHEEPEVGLPRKYALYACIIIALIGLVSAYIAGSCRDTRTTVSVIITLVTAFILLAVLLKCRSSPAPQNGENQRTDNVSMSIYQTRWSAKRLRDIANSIQGKKRDVLRKEMYNASVFELSHFEYLQLFFTIVQNDHWAVVVVNFMQKQFNVFDSRSEDPDYVSTLEKPCCKPITNFKTLVKERNPWKHDLDTFERFSPPGYPQQSTTFDCGIFSILYMENLTARGMKPFNTDTISLLNVRKYVAAKLFKHPQNTLSSEEEFQALLKNS